MPHRFYLPAPPPGDLLPVPEDEAHHLVRVMRLGPGAPVEALDGAGHLYVGELAEVTKRGALMRVHRIEDLPMPTPALHLLVAPTKNLDRLEWLLEKATEIGLVRFTPLLTQRAERRELKLERLRKIAIAALKQSGQGWLPLLDELTPLAQALATVPAGTGFIAHLTQDPAERVALAHASRDLAQVAILIGPEGDFTPDEVARARAAGSQPVTLGRAVLRTETAALFAACVVMGRE